MTNRVRVEVTAEDKATGVLGGIKSAFGDMAKIAGGFVIGQGLLKLPSLFTSATDAAIALGESTNAVNQIFGESADAILNWGKQNANSFGLSQAAFQQMATPLGAMLKNAGLSMDAVTGSTIDLTKRAADMASVFNTDVSDALAAIQAGLRGEADPLERYGVSLKASAVQAKALAMTGKTVASALTEEELALARVQLIMDQTSDVAGDFAATSGEAANAARIQAAQQEELAAQIGQHLLPIQLALTQAKLAFVEVLATKVIPAVSEVGRVLRDKLEGPIKAVVNFFKENESAWQAAAVAIGTVLVAAFTAFTAAVIANTIALLANPFVLVTVAIAALAAGVFLLIKHWDDLTAKYPALAQAQEIAVTAFNAVKTAIEAVVRFVKDELIPALESMWPVVKPVIDQVIAYFQLLWTTFSESISLIKNLITGDFSGAWEDAKDILRGFQEFFGTTIENVKAFVSELGPRLGELAKAAFGYLWSGMIEVWLSIKGWLEELPGKVVSALGDLGHLLYQAGIDLVQGFIDGILSMAEKVVDAIDSVIPGNVGGLLGIGQTGRTQDDYFPGSTESLRSRLAADAGGGLGTVMVNGQRIAISKNAISGLLQIGDRPFTAADAFDNSGNRIVGGNLQNWGFQPVNVTIEGPGMATLASELRVNGERVFA